MQWGGIMKIDLKESHLTLEEAIKQASSGDVLYLENKTYFEKITVNIPNLTLIGQENTKITYNAYHGGIIPKEFGGDGKAIYGTTGSATFTVKETAFGFTAKNIIFENSYQRLDMPNGQAVAFKSECSHLLVENCTFISAQDTLYLDYGKNNRVVNCVIQGDVDFIFGSADCLFERCKIHAIDNEKKIAYYTAPDTFISNEFGFIFRECSFTSDPQMELYLGRPWFPSGAKEKVYPRIAFQNCSFPENIHLYLLRMHPKDCSNYSILIENCTF